MATIIHRSYLLRHAVYTRILHWFTAIFFVLSLMTGFAVYSPMLFTWIAPLFGGGAMTRLLHPWFGLLFDLLFLFQFKNWFKEMVWNDTDKEWMDNVKAYALNEEALAPEYVGKFNAGQKMFFWATGISGIVFLLTGLFMWFGHPFAITRILIWPSYILHDIAALVMLGFFLLHIYQSTANQPGTFNSMIDGTVSDKWAWTHHPAWYKKVTGQDPKQAYEQAVKVQNWGRKKDDGDVLDV